MLFRSVDLHPGLPALNIVGLADATIKEAKEFDYGYTLLEAELQTGRTHQIRVQFLILNQICHLNIFLPSNIKILYILCIFFYKLFSKQALPDTSLLQNLLKALQPLSKRQNL